MKRIALNHSPFLHLFNEGFNNTKRATNFLTKVPAVNILENKENFSVELAAPSYEKSDFKIEIDKNILTVSTEKSNITEEKKDKYSLREFAYNTFSRSFTLPKNVKKDEISATYEGGVLTLSLPKLTIKTHKVEVA